MPMCSRAATLSCRLSALRGSAGRFGSVPRRARTIFLAMMMGFTSAQTICTNTCTDASDGDCDDGGPGSDYNRCDIGTDCVDCGTRPDRLTLCSSGCGNCLSGTGGTITLIHGSPNEWDNEYYYKTEWSYTCSACEGVASGGVMFIYQAYNGITSFASARNVYLWFDCSIGRWTRSVVPAGSSYCSNRYACIPSSTYPTGDTIGPAWSSCPTLGAPSCLAPPPRPPPLPRPPPPPSPQPPLTLCPSGCGACGDGPLTFTGLPTEYYYKTAWYNTCNACSGVASGGRMYVYQAYNGITSLASRFSL